MTNKLETKISTNLSDFPWDILYSLEFCALEDEIKRHEVCSKKCSIDFDLFQKENSFITGQVMEIAINKSIFLYTIFIYHYAQEKKIPADR